MFGFVCRTASKPNLHVMMAGESSSAKCARDHCVQVTSHQHWGLVSKIRCRPPMSLVSGEGQRMSYFEAVRPHSPLQ